MEPMKERDCVEGEKALENFERMATAVFKVSKAKADKPERKKSPSSRKPKNSDKD